MLDQQNPRKECNLIESHHKEENYYVSPLCHCDKEMDYSMDDIPHRFKSFGWCSDESEIRGAHQKVISFSLYDGVRNEKLMQRYYDLLNENILIIEENFPDWTVRIYHNFTADKEEEETVYMTLCDLFCRFSIVDLCNVPQLVERLKAINDAGIDPELIRGMHPILFRNLVMLDPNVDVFLVRDTDSLTFPREVNGVKQWLASNYSFHVMRDHPKLHKSLVPAGKLSYSTDRIKFYREYLMSTGLWGAKLAKERRSSMKEMMVDLLKNNRQEIGYHHQEWLDRIVWNFIKHDVVIEKIVPTFIST